MNGELATLAADAYVYGYPLVADVSAVGGFVRQGLGMTPAAPFNSFSHAPRLAGPEDRFVSINNDTVYSIAQVDVSSGPVLLRVPEAAGRYYVLQFVDAWTNNFAYVGRRATGTSPGTFLLAPPQWKSGAPEGTTVIEFPTTVGTIVGRWACAGLRRAAGEPLTIEIQHERPPDTSNWLPAPFRPILRLYQPRASVLDGSYRIPPIRKAGRQSPSASYS